MTMKAGPAGSANKPPRASTAGGASEGGRGPAPTESIRVVARCRPAMPHEAKIGTEILSVDGEQGFVTLDMPAGDGGSGKVNQRRVKFNHAFPASATQKEVFAKSEVVEMVDKVLDGFHGTVLAYGQTGTGKTFTMEGHSYAVGTAVVGTGKDAEEVAVPYATPERTPEANLGVTHHCIETLFQKMAERAVAAAGEESARTYTVRVSYLQLYNEKMHDLLNPMSFAVPPAGMGGDGGAPIGGEEGLLRLRQQRGQFFVDNLVTIECQSAAEVHALFLRGVRNKRVASHGMNVASSRSHCLFTLHVDVVDLANPDETVTSKLNLVDLAGSERQAHTGAEGEVLKESIKINQSLFSLRQVISSLAQRQRAILQAENVAASPLPQGLKPAHAIKKGAGAGKGVYSGTRGSARQRVGQDPKKIARDWHVPYRDSKLTSLLKHSLGGTGLTLIICCFSPSDEFAEENASTLEFASRARSVRNLMVKNEDPKVRLIREQREEIDRLQRLVGDLRAELRAAGSAGFSVSPGLLDDRPAGRTSSGGSSWGGGDLSLPPIRPASNSSSSPRVPSRPGNSSGSSRGSAGGGGVEGSMSGPPRSRPGSRGGSQEGLGGGADPGARPSSRGGSAGSLSGAVGVAGADSEGGALGGDAGSPDGGDPSRGMQVLSTENELLRQELAAALRYKSQAAMLAQENAELRAHAGEGGGGRKGGLAKSAVDLGPSAYRPKRGVASARARSVPPPGEELQK